MLRIFLTWFAVLVATGHASAQTSAHSVARELLEEATKYGMEQATDKVIERTVDKAFDSEKINKIAEFVLECKPPKITPSCVFYLVFNGPSAGVDDQTILAFRSRKAKACGQFLSTYLPLWRERRIAHAEQTKRLNELAGKAKDREQELQSAKAALSRAQAAVHEQSRLVEQAGSKVRALEAVLASRDAEIRSLTDARTAEEATRDRYRALAAEPYKCPISGVTYDKCDTPWHAQFKQKFDEDRRNHEAMAKKSQDSAESMRTRLAALASERGRLKVHMQGLENSLRPLRGSLEQKKRTVASAEQRVEKASARLAVAASEYQKNRPRDTATALRAIHAGDDVVLMCLGAYSEVDGAAAASWNAEYQKVVAQTQIPLSDLPFPGAGRIAGERDLWVRSPASSPALTPQSGRNPFDAPADTAPARNPFDPPTPPQTPNPFGP